MEGSDRTNGLLQTLITQLNEYAKEAATKEDIGGLRSLISSELNRAHERINDIQARCVNQITKCAELHGSFNTTLGVMQRKIGNEADNVVEKSKEKADLRGKLILASVVAVLTILATAVTEYLRGHGIIFTNR